MPAPAKRTTAYSSPFMKCFATELKTCLPTLPQQVQSAAGTGATTGTSFMCKKGADYSAPFPLAFYRTTRWLSNALLFCIHLTDTAALASVAKVSNPPLTRNQQPLATILDAGMLTRLSRQHLTINAVSDWQHHRRRPLYIPSLASDVLKSAASLRPSVLTPAVRSSGPI